MLKSFDTITDEERSNVRVISNFHTHNYLCGHADGTVSDYAKRAVECGITILGISDHCRPPVNYGDAYALPDAIDALYLPQFVEARKKYGDKVTLLAGVEVEFCAGYDSYYQMLKSKLDYMVMGQHGYFLDGEWRNSFCDGVDDRTIAGYFGVLREGIKSGYFAVVAHPDVIFYNKPPVTERVKHEFDLTVAEAARCGVAMELNANGVRGHGFRYPTELLFELCKKHDAPVVISADAHTPRNLSDSFVVDVHAFAKRRGLNIVDTVKTFR